MNKKRDRKINKVWSAMTNIVLAVTYSFAFIFPPYEVVFAADGGSNESLSVADADKAGDSNNKNNNSATPTPALTKKEKKQLEEIMKGLSTFDFQGYKWPDSLTVGRMAFSLAESIYTMTAGIRSGDGAVDTPVLWKTGEVEESMKHFYSSTNWNNFAGMYETVEISNSCEAILSDEVAAYAKLMDDAASEYGFSIYKEIFKAMAQARFNEHKNEYEEIKSQGKIKGEGTDPFDLFHINGSWFAQSSHGDSTPVGIAKAPTPTPTTALQEPSSPDTDAPLLATPTPKIVANPETLRDRDTKNAGTYTVKESIDIAAKEFSSIIEDAVFPSPYDTNSLMGAVQGFEFGGKSTEIKRQFNSSSVKLEGENGFVSFAQYFSKKAPTNKNQSAEQEDIDYDKIIEDYAKVVAHGKTRPESDKDEYGSYKYSDQKFYQKVFENYKCSGGGTMDYGQLPEDMKEILRQCMQTWDSRVTKERREIIQQGVLLYGVTYSMGDNGEPARNSPSIENPKYLDCSSFVGQSYWRAGVLGQESVHWTTGDFADGNNQMRQIQESELIPGDMGQLDWAPGASGGSHHIGIFIGKVNGQSYYIHCTGHSPEAPGVRHPVGKGIVINAPGSFKVFGRYAGLD